LFSSLILGSAFNDYTSLCCGDTGVCRILPESVVWLCAQDRVDDAERIIRNAAKLNNISMPENILARRSTELDETAGEGWTGNQKKNPFAKFTNLARLRRAQKKDDEHAPARYTLLDVFRNLRLALYCVCMSFLWSVTVLLDRFLMAKYCDEHVCLSARIAPEPHARPLPIFVHLPMAMARSCSGWMVKFQGEGAALEVFLPIGNAL